MACDFVPTLCSALAIKTAQELRQCKLPELRLPGLSAQVTAGLEYITETQQQLNEYDLCIMLALAQACARANVPFPSFPAQAEPPDLSECADALTALQAHADQPLGVMQGIVNIDVDAEGLPTRIFNS